MVPLWYVHVYVLSCYVTTLIGKGHTCAPRTTCVFMEDTRQPVERERMQVNTHLHSRYRPHTTASTARSTAGMNRHFKVCEHVGLDTNQSLHSTYVPTIMVPSVRTMVPLWYQGTYVRTYVRTYNVMSQLSDWKRAHMCTENHVCLRGYTAAS
jgi:hypothetical protein